MMVSKKGLEIDMTDHRIPPQDKALEDYLAAQTMKKTYSRFGWALVALLATWYGFLIAVSIVFGVMEALGISMLDFYERYMLIFNELGLVISIIVVMPILRPLPKYEIYGERIGVWRFAKYITIALAIGMIGNVIGNSMLSFWNSVTGNEAGAEVDELLLGSNFYILLLMVGLVAPFLEEFFFRKLLIDHTRQYGELPCILMSGALFGLFHGNFTQFFYAFGLGALLAYIYFRSGNFTLVFIFHAAFNLVSGILPAMLMSVSETLEMAYMYVYMILVVIGIVFAFIGIRKFKPRKGEILLPRKTCFSAMIGNSGMIAAVLFMLMLMTLSLFTIE